MFAQLSALTSVDAANLDAANVTDMNGMFMESGNIESVILSGLDTSKVENMADMFKLCTGLSTLDLTGLSTESVSDMSAMFDGCSSLATIYASESFVIGPDTAHGDMFAGCASLAGGMGTAYDPDHTDGAYARIDDGLGGPGYFTDKDAPAVTYTLMDGPSFNELLKSDPSAYVGSVTFGNRATLADIIDGLSGDDFIHVGATENDKVYMVKIPTGDVQKQVYVIADSFNGSTKIAANENSAQMFYQCDKLTGLDLSVLDVSQVKNHPENRTEGERPCFNRLSLAEYENMLSVLSDLLMGDDIVKLQGYHWKKNGVEFKIDSCSDEKIVVQVLNQRAIARSRGN